MIQADPSRIGMKVRRPASTRPPSIQKGREAAPKKIESSAARQASLSHGRGSNAPAVRGDEATRPDSGHRPEILSAFIVKASPLKARMLSQETVKSARVLRRGKASDMLFAALVKTLGHSRAQTVDFYL